MISIVMPYWNRPEALLRTLESYKNLYSNIKLEIVIVDDGSQNTPSPSEIDKLSLPKNFNLKIVKGPNKTEAKNPCVPLNAGVSVAKGSIIFLTNPEVVHTESVIPAMVNQLASLGPSGYVAAACRCERSGAWLCKSDAPATPGRAKTPDGAGLHFFACLHRPFYYYVGGFDEQYRDGQAYEDNDFLWALFVNGAAFKIMDDCVVTHSRAPRTTWPSGGLSRNKAIFEKKWSSLWK